MRLERLLPPKYAVSPEDDHRYADRIIGRSTQLLPEETQWFLFYRPRTQDMAWRTLDKIEKNTFWKRILDEYAANGGNTGNDPNKRGWVVSIKNRGSEVLGRRYGLFWYVEAPFEGTGRQTARWAIRSQRRSFITLNRT